jgi:hypothetical protein
MRPKIIHQYLGIVALSIAALLMARFELQKACRQRRPMNLAVRDSVSTFAFASFSSELN